MQEVLTTSTDNKEVQKELQLLKVFFLLDTKFICGIKQNYSFNKEIDGKKDTKHQILQLLMSIQNYGFNKEIDGKKDTER